MGVLLLCGWGMGSAGAADTGVYCQVAGPSALSFDGVDDYVNLGNKASLQLTGNVTIAAWVRLAEDNSGQYMGIAGKLSNSGGASYRGFALVRYSNDRFRFLVANGVVNGIDSTDTYTDTDWHHVVGILEGGVMKIYVDGVFNTQGGSGLTVVDSGQYAFIGQQYSDGTTRRFFNGAIDDVRIYSRALTASQVTSAMTTVPVGPQTGLVGYWNLDEGAGQTVNDLSGNSNQGFLGGVTTADSADPTWLDTSSFCVSEKTYYVDGVHGIDTNNGLTTAKAFKTIQRGITVAGNGDTVMVLAGVYRGTGNKELDFGGKAIVVRSQDGPASTVIDCQGSGRAFYFHSSEGASSMVDGFTLTGGNSTKGAAVYCVGSSPTIRGCQISSNTTSSTSSGIIYCTTSSSAVITGCTIKENTGNSSAVRFDNSAGQVINCLLYDNSVSASGGAIRCENGNKTTVVRNCTVAGNGAVGSGGGLWAKSATVQVSNSIFWGNTATTGGAQMSTTSPATLTVSYSDVAGGRTAVTGTGTVSWGTGNLDADPLFADPNGGDYRLKSTRGRYWAEHQVWVLDTESSPCLDTGDPTSGFDLEPQPNGGRINMGWDGDTAYASLSPSNEGTGLVGDVNGDGVIDFTDLFALIDQWLALFGDQVSPSAPSSL
jgi:hypothetical protein